MTFRPRETALLLQEIARKVRYLPAPSHRDPEAFHIARSEQASEIDRVAHLIWPEVRSPGSITDIRRPPTQNTNDLPRSPRRK